MTNRQDIVIRSTRATDIPQIIDLCTRTYSGAEPWSEKQIESHLAVFPEGQLVAVDAADRLCGMSASLIVFWDEYDHWDNWREFTAHGYFTNHDPLSGKTLYGAEVMVDPEYQGMGIGKKLYAARRQICIAHELKRIRAGARLRGYHRYAADIPAAEYVRRVISGQIGDPTLSFQLKQGFTVLAVVQGYLRHDPESLGWAALIEWLNPQYINEVPPPLRESV
ncbi:hypothetical protein BH10PLA1_BH10PLA1_19630 [soil metagenome]